MYWSILLLILPALGILIDSFASRAGTLHRTSHPQISAIRAPWNGPAAVRVRSLVALARHGDSPSVLRAELAELTSFESAGVAR